MMNNSDSPANVPKYRSSVTAVDFPYSSCSFLHGGSGRRRSDGLGNLGALLLRVSLLRKDLVLGLDDGDVVGERSLGSGFARRIVGQHDFHLDAQNSLTQEDVSDGGVDVLLGGVAAVNHQTIDELHRLGSLTAKLAGNHHFASLGAGLHDKPEDAIAGATNGETADEFVAERLGLSDGAKTAGRNLLGVELDCAIGIVEPLLDDRSEFANALAFVTQHILSPSRQDDDLRARRSHAHLDATVSVFRELTSEELVEFSLEDSILDELSLLGNLNGHLEFL